MITAKYLSPLRIWYLLRRDFNRLWKDFLITIGGVLGFFLIVLMVTAKTGTVAGTVHWTFLSLILFVFGLLFTSSAFKEAHKKLQNHDWLMLPASTVEKFTEKLLLYAVVFPVAAIALYSVFSLIAGLVIHVFMGEYFPAFNPFNASVWKLAGHYVIAQSVFILGAAWFRKNNFIMTIISLVIFSIVISLVSTLIGWIVFNDYFWTIIRADFNLNLNLNEGFNSMKLEGFGLGILNLMRVLYYGLTAPVCWVGAWLKLREVEVNNGV